MGLSGYKPTEQLQTAERLQTNRAGTDQPSGYKPTVRLQINRRQILVLARGEPLLLARPLDHPIFHPVGGW